MFEISFGFWGWAEGFRKSLNASKLFWVFDEGLEDGFQNASIPKLYCLCLVGFTVWKEGLLIEGLTDELIEPFPYLINLVSFEVINELFLFCVVASLFLSLFCSSSNFYIGISPSMSTTFRFKTSNYFYLCFYYYFLLFASFYIIIVLHSRVFLRMWTNCWWFVELVEHQGGNLDLELIDFLLNLSSYLKLGIESLKDTLENYRFH